MIVKNTPLKSAKNNCSSHLLVALVTAIALFSGRQASAQYEFFNNQAGYNAASYSIVDLTFNGETQAANSYTSFGEPGSLVAGGVTITTPSNTALYAIGPQYVGGSVAAYDVTNEYNFPGDNTTTMDAEVFTGGPAVVNIALPANVLPAGPPPQGVTAVGVNIASTFVGGTITATVTLVGGVTEVFSDAVPAAETSGLSFIGFVDTNNIGITSISFSDSTPDASGQPDMVFDNLNYGTYTPSAVPEPSAWALMLAGVALLAWRIRARRV